MLLLAGSNPSDQSQKAQRPTFCDWYTQCHSLERQPDFFLDLGVDYVRLGRGRNRLSQPDAQRA